MFVGINIGPLRHKVVGQVGAREPDVLVSHDPLLEYWSILVSEFFELKPRALRVNIVNSANIRQTYRLSRSDQP